MMRTWDSGRWRAFEPGDLSPEDRGFLLGDGVFETMRVAGGRIRHAAAHRDRFEAACAALDLDCLADWAGIEAEVKGFADGATLRLTLTRGPGPRGIGPIAEARPAAFLADFPPAEIPASLRLATSTLRRVPGSLACRYKTLSYADNAAARREAARAGADMALILTTDGHVSGGDCANLFWLSHDRLFTPGRDCAIREGVMREAVLGAASGMGLDIQEGVFAPGALDAAGAVFVTNAAMGVVPIHGIDARAIKTGHPVMSALRDAVFTAG